jgi:hypothetical protein
MLFWGIIADDFPINMISGDQKDVFLLVQHNK